MSAIDDCNLCLNSPIILLPSHIVYPSYSQRMLLKQTRICYNGNQHNGKQYFYTINSFGNSRNRGYLTWARNLGRASRINGLDVALRDPTCHCSSNSWPRTASYCRIKNVGLNAAVYEDEDKWFCPSADSRKICKRSWYISFARANVEEYCKRRRLQSQTLTSAEVASIFQRWIN